MFRRSYLIHHVGTRVVESSNIGQALRLRAPSASSRSRRTSIATHSAPLVLELVRRPTGAEPAREVGAGGPGGATPRLDEPPARPGRGGVGRARCRPVKRQCPATHGSSAATPHPLALDGVPSGDQLRLLAGQPGRLSARATAVGCSWARASAGGPWPQGVPPSGSRFASPPTVDSSE
jgi:hypothetical protein